MRDNDGLYRQPNSRYWYGTFTNKSGRRIRRSTGKTDRAEARVVRAQWIAREGATGQSQAIHRTFDELMLGVLDAPYTLKGRPKTQKTLARDEGCIKAMAAHLTGHFLVIAGGPQVPEPRLDGPRVHQYVADRRVGGATDSTIRRELSVLGAAVNYANTRWSWGVEDPTRGRKPSQGDSRIRWITRAEAARLIAAAQSEPRAPFLADWITVALHTGCRKDELLGLTWDRVDLGRNVLLLEAEHNKSRRRQVVPLNATAREALVRRARYRAEHCPGVPWVFARGDCQRVGDIKRAFSTAVRRAGLDDFTPHDCRHTCASWLVMAGVPLATVKEVLRHSSIVVTEQYAHLAPESAREAVEILDGQATAPVARNWLDSIG